MFALLSHRSAALGSSRRAWEGLVRVFREVEGTAWGGVLLDNVWPAYVFGLPLGARIWSLARAPLASAELSTHEQARLVQELVTICFLGLVVVLFAVRRRGIAGQRSTFWPGAVAIVGTFLLNVVAYLPIADTTATSALLVSSGVVVLGTLFTIWSLITLGRCFGLLPEARGLVRQGPYRLVRHPVYLGELISGLGLLLAKPHPLVVVLFGLFAVLQYQRTVYEERALEAAFPAEYPAYRRSVPRLVPGLRA